MMARAMAGASWHRIRTRRGLATVALLGPLLVPAAAWLLRRAAAVAQVGAAPDPSWQLLLLAGPAIPLYLILLPLLPFSDNHNFDIFKTSHCTDKNIMALIISQPSYRNDLEFGVIPYPSCPFS